MIKVWIDDGKAIGQFCFTTSTDVVECEPDRNWRAVEIRHELLDSWFAVNTLIHHSQNEMARLVGEEQPYHEDCFYDDESRTSVEEGSNV